MADDAAFVKFVNSYHKFQHKTIQEIMSMFPSVFRSHPEAAMAIIKGEVVLSHELPKEITSSLDPAMWQQQ